MNARLPTPVFRRPRVKTMLAATLVPVHQDTPKGMMATPAMVMNGLIIQCVTYGNPYIRFAISLYLQI